MARVDLSQLAGNIGLDDDAEDPPIEQAPTAPRLTAAPDPEAAPAAVAEASSAAAIRTDEQPAATTTPSRPRRSTTKRPRGRDRSDSSEPYFRTLARKETRLRPDQVRELAEISFELNRDRHGAGERITENTLIRLAVDLLLADKRLDPESATAVYGITSEDELRRKFKLG